MKLTPGNFLVFIKNLVTGGGYQRDGVNVKNDAGFLVDRFLPASALATTGTRTTATNSLPADVMIIDADGEDAIINLQVPRDYDETTDYLKGFLIVRYVSGTSIALQADAVSKANPRLATELAALTGFTAATATTVASTTVVGEVPVTITGKLLKRSDLLAINFAASATTGSGIAHILGFRWEYRSTLVSFNETDGATPSTGNPLR